MKMPASTSRSRRAGKNRRGSPRVPGEAPKRGAPLKAARLVRSLPHPPTTASGRANGPRNLCGGGVRGGGAAAGTTGGLIAARLVMGVGAAVIFPTTLSIISNTFSDRRERAQAIGIWGAITGIGVATGPLAGGWLLEHFWWGSVFLYMAPVAA